MTTNNVAILRVVYCMMAVKNLEAQLDPKSPLPHDGTFFAPWGERFCVEIIFGVPGCGDFEYSAQLTVYVPTAKLGQVPGDIFVRCTAVDGEGVDVPTRITAFSDKLGSDPAAERNRATREMACEIICEKICDFARQARIDLRGSSQLIGA